MQQDRLSNLDVFRALAALVVCLFHFDRNGFLGVSAVSGVLRHGYLGVDVFFVISGFIIPFSLCRSGYEFKDMRAFLVSRLIRLYPAYLVAGIAAVALWYISTLVPGFRGEHPSFSSTQIISNIFLLCDFTGTSWFIPVFWTLAIEAQYYVLIAISFPLMLSKSPALRWCIMAVWVFAPLLVGSGPSVFSYSALFALGIVTFQWKANRVGMSEFVITIILAALVHGSIGSSISATVSVAATLAIAFAPRINFSPMVWIGVVSYSLYLIHIPFGGRVINFAERLPEIIWIRAAAIIIALLVSIAVAAVFYNLIEKPSHALSRNVRKRLTNTGEQDADDQLPARAESKAE